MEKVKDVLAKAIAWVKAHAKVVAIVAVVVIVAIFLISFITGGPKRAVKNYVAAMNKAKAEKIMKCVDVKGTLAWIECGGEEDEFLDAYDDIDDDEVEEYEEQMQDSMEEYCDYIDDNFKKYSVKVKKIKDVEKVDKGLYKVKAQIEMKTVTDDEDEDEEEETSTTTFYVYKNKIISSGL